MKNSTHENSGKETPLESWKEIAAYLQRDVRTAKRWEKSERLPVHRHWHLSRSSVYAYPGELQAWRAGRNPQPEARPLWRLPLASAAFTLVLSLALLSTGSSRRSGKVEAADGIVSRQVWTDADGVLTNAPSPDGKHMSYTDWPQGNLAIRDLEAETSRLLTNEGRTGPQMEYAYASKWSPDGKQLAYSWYRQSTEELRLVSLDKPLPQVLLKEDGITWTQPLDWSPDGKQILAGIARTGKPDQLALIPVEGGSPRVLKTVEEGSALSDVALFSPDGRYIAFGRTPGKVAASDLFVLDVSGGAVTPLVQHPSDDCVFGWDPSGNWVLFLSDRAGTLDFWAIRVADGKAQGTPVRVKRSVGRVAPLGFTRDGSFYYAEVKAALDVYAAKVDFQTGKVLSPAQKAIARFEGSNMNPRYSPDGKSLAYVSRRGSKVFPTNRANALCVHSLESGSERVYMDEFVRLGVRDVAGPRWLPDSRSIVIAGLRVVGAGSGLYRVNLDTGNISPVAEMPPGVRIRSHELSGESRRLFYIRENTNRKLCQVLEHDLWTGEERELHRMSLPEPTWSGGPSGIAASRDGKWLAMFMPGRGVLSIMPSGGGTPREVQRPVPKGYYANPEWTEDGRHVLLGGIVIPDQTKAILYKVPVEGRNPQEIMLQSSFWDRPSLHPDGLQIAFTRMINYPDDADVWVMHSFLPK